MNDLVQQPLQVDKQHHGYDGFLGIQFCNGTKEQIKEKQRMKQKIANQKKHLV